jgi:hypothetical protein
VGLLNALKNRVSTNLKVTQLSYMSHPSQIAAFCRALPPDEQAAVMKGIEGAFKWLPVAQIAQSMFPAYYSGGVSPEALDLVMGGQVSGGIELMRQQNQYVAPPSYGFTPAQQASLSFAWVLLNALKQAGSNQPSPMARGPDDRCAHCGKSLEPSAKFCSGCGARV